MNASALLSLDRRLIYFIVLVAVSIPIITGWAVKPARLPSAKKLFEVIEGIDTSRAALAMIAMDFGPGTHAENEPQTEVVVEHIMRRRIKFAVFSLVPIADPFLTAIPERVAARLMKEMPGEKWEYGTDWVNLGYKPGADLFVQALARSDDLAGFLGKDVYGNDLIRLPVFKGIKGFKDIPFLGQFTGLVGTFATYVQFFQRKDYVPRFGHGCTSITIPEAYIYLDSGQLSGLLEGLSGAAWYSELLKERDKERAPDNALIMNTALGVAQLAVIILVAFGNIVPLVLKWQQKT